MRSHQGAPPVEHRPKMRRGTVALWCVIWEIWLEGGKECVAALPLGGVLDPETDDPSAGAVDGGAHALAAPSEQLRAWTWTDASPSPDPCDGVYRGKGLTAPLHLSSHRPAETATNATDAADVDVLAEDDDDARAYHTRQVTHGKQDAEASGALTCFTAAGSVVRKAAAATGFAVREAAATVAFATQQELSRATAEIAREASAAFRYGAARFRWSYVAAVVFIAVPVGIFRLVSSAPTTSLEGFGLVPGGFGNNLEQSGDANRGAASAAPGRTPRKMPSIGLRGGDNEAIPAGAWELGGRVPDMAPAGELNTNDADALGGAVDALGAQVRGAFTTVGSAAHRNVFTVGPRTVHVAAGGATKGSARWQDAAWRVHRDRYAVMDIPICRSGGGGACA